MPRLYLQNFKGSTLFNGTSSRVVVTTPSVLDFRTSFTISAWVKPKVASATTSGELYIWSKALPASSTYKIALYMGINNTLRGAIYDGVTNPAVGSSDTNIVGRWQHVALTYDGVSMKIYRNGVNVGTVATSLDPGAQTSDVEIGRRAGASDRWFNGCITDVRSFSSALSEKEIFDLYRTGGVSVSPVGWWKLNETASSSFTDLINANNGTGTGTTFSLDTPSRLRKNARPMGGSTVFNGSTSTINITNSGGQVFNNQNYVAVSCWVNPTSFPGTSYIFAHQSTATNNRIYLNTNSSGNVIISMGSSAQSVSGPALQKNRWTHLVGVYDRVKPALYLYVDGIIVNSLETGIAAPGAGLVDVQIGSRIAAAEGFSGKIADMRFYASNTELFDGEKVAKLYSSGVNPVGPISQWSLADQPSSYIDVISGNTGTGTSTTFSNDVPVAARKVIQKSLSSASGTAVSPNSSIDPSSGSTTVIFDAYTTSFTGTTVFAFCSNSGTADADIAYRFNISSGYPFIWEWNTSGAGAGYTAPAVSGRGLDEWVRFAVCVTTNGVTTTGKIYMNGQLVSSSSLSRDMRTYTRFVVYSSSEYRTCNYLVYERELTDQEIMSNYTRGSIPSRPKIKWDRSEGSGNTNYDSSGNGNDGTGGTLTWYANSPSLLRKVAGGNMVRNGDFAFIPKSNAALTANNWIDGTAAGSSTNDLFGWRKYSSTTSATATFTENGLQLYNPGGLSTYNYIGTDPQVALANPSLANMLRYGIKLKPSTSYTVKVVASVDSAFATNQSTFRVQELKGDATIVFNQDISFNGLTSEPREYHLVFTTNSTTQYAVILFWNGAIGVTSNANTLTIKSIKIFPTATAVRSTTT